MTNSVEILTRELQAKMREFWFSVIEEAEDPDKFMPGDMNDAQKTFAYSYYIALVQISGEALKNMIAEAAEADVADVRAKADEEPKRYFDANPNFSNKTPEERIKDAGEKLRELEEGVQSGKLVYKDEILKNTDAVFAGFRSDLMTLPFELLKSSKLDSIDEFRAACQAQLAVVLGRLQDEIGQAVAGAVRQSQHRGGS